MRENCRVAAIPLIHEASAELTAEPRFEGLTMALERNEFDSKGETIKVYLPTAIQTLEQQEEVVSELNDFAAKWKLESVVEPYGVVLMTSPAGG